VADTSQQQARKRSSHARLIAPDSLRPQSPVTQIHACTVSVSPGFCREPSHLVSIRPPAARFRVRAIGAALGTFPQCPHPAPPSHPRLRPIHRPTLFFRARRRWPLLPSSPALDPTRRRLPDPDPAAPAGAETWATLARGATSTTSTRSTTIPLQTPTVPRPPPSILLPRTRHFPPIRRGPRLLPPATPHAPHRCCRLRELLSTRALPTPTLPSFGIRSMTPDRRPRSPIPPEKETRNTRGGIRGQVAPGA
jgi:hypothetical protein